MSAPDRAPAERPQRLSRASLAVCFVALLGVLHALSFLGSGPIDDDFITYRYARNWLDGHGLVFNPGERFEGFTVPLWVFMIAAGLKLGVRPEVLVPVVSIAAAGAAALAVGRVWRRRFPEAAWPVPALFVAASPAFAWHAVAGLGTTLLAALLALWLDLYDRAARAARPSIGAAVCLALACLLRQEAALFVPVYLALELRRRRSVALVLPLLTLAGWTLFRRVYYGSWLPVTYSVKKLPILDDLRFGLDYMAGATLVTGVGLFLLATLLLRLSRQRAEDGPARAARAGLWLHAFYVVWVGGDFVPLARFVVPVLPLFVLLGSAGVAAAVRPRGLRVALTVLVLVATQWVQLERPQRFGEHAFFEERWARLGQHFAATVAADTSVAISPIGAFGYYSRLPIVDILGLTHDGLLDVEPALDEPMKGHQRFDAEWVLSRDPDFIILANGVRQPDGKLIISRWEQDLFLSPDFQARYRHMRAPIPGDAPLDVFRRADATPLPGSIPAASARPGAGRR